MAASLQENLQSLNDCLTSEDLQIGGQKAHSIVGDIGQYCLQDVTSKDIDYACSILFDRENGVTPFLKKTVSVDQFQHSKAELLEMLRSFVEKFPKKVVPYAVELKNVCMSIFMREKYAAVKKGAIPIIIELLRQCAGSPTQDDLQITALIEKLFTELSKPASKHTPTVRQQIYHVLGVLAELYPEKMVMYSEKLLEIYIRVLKTETTVKSRKPELSLIAGCLQGLTALLTQFSHSAQEGGRYARDIFSLSLRAAVRRPDLARYEMPRAALGLLQRHADQLREFLVEEHAQVWSMLRTWCCHGNREMAHAAYGTMDSFLKQVSDSLVSSAHTAAPGGGATFKFFIREFRRVLSDPAAPSKEVTLAVRGYGYFAAPCKHFLSDADVRFMFNEMIQRSEQMFFGDETSLSDRVMSLPSFLESLASIVCQLDAAALGPAFLGSVERLVIVLMENHVKLSPKMHYPSFLALLHVLFAVAPKGAVFRGFLSRIVYQGVIRSCSHPVVLESVDSPTDPGDPDPLADPDFREQRVSYRDYVPMWQSLLNDSNVKELSSLGVSLATRRRLTEAVYNELVDAVLSITERLDLTASRSTEATEDGAETEILTSADPASTHDPGGGDLVTSDPVRGLHAARPKDFLIFINLVDFTRAVLPGRHEQLFQPWVFTFGHRVITHSARFPLVSGFYKLLAVCLDIAGKTHYFKSIEENVSVSGVKVEIKTEEDEDDKMDVDSPIGNHSDQSQKEAAFLLFNKFTKEVAVRLKQYKDDLLASCLFFVLSLPREIVAVQIQNLIPALQTTFALGLSYLPLAEAGLAALEAWSAALPPTTLRPLYRDVLPALQPYLNNTGTDVSETVAMEATSGSGRRGRRKIPVRLIQQGEKGKSRKAGQSVPATVSATSVRLRAVRLLGSLGGAVNHDLLGAPVAPGDGDPAADPGTGGVTAWDSRKHVKFDVPFVDIKPSIYFDNFLPRIVDLALTSSDRQTKVAASELLHSLILYMLGRSAAAPAATSTTAAPAEPMAALYRRVFPAAVRLATDVEQVCRALFEPLMMQLIHWLTGNRKYESEDTRVLLDTLMECVENPADTAVRDFSAKCIREFTKWSIKQTSRKQLETSAHNIRSLWRRLSLLARHPSAYKRLGAALAFNSIYNLIREEKALVDVFVFEMLVVFVDSLALAHTDDTSLGTVTQCEEVLVHLQRIVLHYKDLLNATSSRRNCPSGWNEATLLTCVRWLLRQCGRPQTHCRHACMTLVTSLIPALPDVTSVSHFFEEMVSQRGSYYFIVRFEGELYRGVSKPLGLFRRPTLTPPAGGEGLSLRSALAWFDLVLAALDCWCWVFQQRLLEPTHMAAAASSGAKPKSGSAVFRVLAHFVADVAATDIYGVAAGSPRGRGEVAAVFTPREVDEYNSAKCTVVVRLLDFISTLWLHYDKVVPKVAPSELWTEPLWDVIVGVALSPATLGFNMADVTVMQQLPLQVGRLLSVMRRKLPTNLLNSFTHRLNHRISKGPLNLLEVLPCDLADPAGATSDLVPTSHLTSGYLLLQQHGFLTTSNMAAKMADRLMDVVWKSVVTKDDQQTTAVAILTPTAKDLGVKILNLAFAVGYPLSRLLTLLQDKTPLGAGAAHGAMFHATYRDTINAHMVNNVTQLAPQLARLHMCEWALVGSILTGMLHVLSRDKDARKRHGGSVVESVLRLWPDLSGWWLHPTATPETRSLALTLLTNMLIVDAKLVTSVKKPHFPPVLDMYLSLLVDTNTNLPFKTQALDLVAFFATLPTEQTALLKTALDRFVADNFPARSTEYSPGSPKYNDYVGALNKLLYGLELSGSLVLLEVLLSVVCREERHAIEDDIQDALARFIRRLARDQQKPALDVAFSVFAAEARFTPSQRRAAVDRVCLPLLRIVATPALVEFFTSHIKAVMAHIEVKLPKDADPGLEGVLVSKLCCFSLAEVMFSRLTRSEVMTLDSRINTAYCGGAPETGKEMATVITKASFAAKSEDSRGCGGGELRRQYHCAAYCCLIAMVTCTQTEVKFYNSLLFAEDPARGKFLWDNIVDTDRKYSFNIELESLPARKKRFVSIRSEHRAASNGSDTAVGAGDTAGAASVHYLASQYLADSSLGSDLSQYDFGTAAAASAAGSVFSGSVGGSVGSAGGRLRRKSKATTPPESSSSESLEDFELELEMDDLNQHECMGALTALLGHMARTGVYPVPQKGDDVEKKMPKWMSDLRAKFTDPNTSLNVRLFIAKLIVNAQQVFRVFSRAWLQSLTQLVVSGVVPGDKTSYFVTDIVVTLLSWQPVAAGNEKPQVERSLASRLAEHWMCHLHHDNRRVLRNNLEVLKTLVEVWRPLLDRPPTQLIYENFTDPDPKNKRNIAGIQMCGVFLANRLSPWVDGAGVDRDRFYKYLAMNMLNHYKNIYSSAAEVVGMALKHLSSTETSAESVEWRETYTENVAKMLSSIQNTKAEQHLTCVHMMHKHHAPAADRFVPRILFILPRVHGEDKRLCLELLASRLSVAVPDVARETRNIDVPAILAHRDEANQLAALRLVFAMVKVLAPDQITYLMKGLAGVCGSGTDECRGLVYDILMWLYDNHRESAGESDSVNLIMSTAKDCLLAGLSDTNEKNRLTVQNFWSSPLRLPSGDTAARLVALLSALYSPASERSFLAYATDLLMAATAASPDYTRPLFEHPLDECTFQDYVVSSSWRSRHAAMTPLFVETPATQAAGGSWGDESSSSLGPGEVRATQDPAAFSQTQQPGPDGKAGPYNWLTQSSLDTFSSDAATFSLSTNQDSSSSSLLFSVGRASAAPARRHRPVGAGFGRDRLTAPAPRQQQAGTGAQTDDGAEILRLKRRFLKDRSDDKMYFAKRQIRINRLREQVEAEQKKRREGTVTMYRKYRSGDLPDIQIPASALIAPLQALAQRDPTTSALLFSAVFGAIYGELDKLRTEREVEEVTETINRCLNEMLERSTQYFPPFIRCVLDIATHNPTRLRLDPASVSVASTASLLQPCGISLLEEVLIRTADTDARPPAAKRSRGSAPKALDEESTSLWLELARLYKSVEDYDVLRGIFSSRFGTKDLTSVAIEAEMRGDYQTALAKYTEALEREDWGGAPPHEAEASLWEDGRLACCNQLGDWSKMAAFCLHAIDDEGDPPDINKVWTDPDSQEHFLPLLLRGKLKLLLTDQEDQEDLGDFVSASLRHPERAALVENRFSEELALLYTYQQNYDRARHYARLALHGFVQEWGGLDSLLVGSRTSKLQNLQKLTELHEFLTFMANNAHFESTSPAQKLLSSWLQRSPDAILDSTPVWDDVITNRLLYLDLVSSRLPDPGAGWVGAGELGLRLAQAEAANTQHNFRVALTSMKRAQQLAKSSPLLHVRWLHTFARIQQRRSLIATDTAADKVRALAGTLTSLEKQDAAADTRDLLAADPSLLQQHTRVKGETAGCLLRLLNDSSLTLSGELQNKVAAAVAGPGSDRSDSTADTQVQLVAGLLEKGFRLLLRGAAGEAAGDAHMALVTYCDGWMRSQEEAGSSETTSPAITREFPATVVTATLAAMKQDCVAARQLFPRLLQLVGSHTEIMESFIQKSAEVPVWMFLAWLSQLTALLDKPEAPAVAPILLQLAAQYPQALVYPYKMSSETYMFDDTETGRKAKAVNEQLLQILSKNRVIEKFMASLEQFGQPNALFKDWYQDEEWKGLLGEKTKRRKTQADLNRIENLYMGLYQQVFDFTAASLDDEESLYGTQSSISSVNTVAMCAYRVRVAKVYKPKLDKIYGPRGSKIQNMTAKEFREQGQKLFAAMRNDRVFTPPTRLAEYSTWLADFQHGRYDELEIPGQYKGDQKPLPDYHVKVCSFREQVKVLTSLQKPKRITICGNDSRDYLYLVKGGEDLRLDQRIQQLFTIMNQIFAADPVCSQRKLSLRTYQVIPMTPRVGMIEWMRKTETLKEFLKEAAEPEKVRPEFSEMSKAKAEHVRMLGGDVSPAHFWAAQDKLSRSDVVTNLRRKEAFTPWDLMRRAYQAMSNSTEAFFTLRQNFATSHALICICQYILGVGDRHLSNFMVDTETGKMVGIDFGHAFGSATVILPIPELIPFRLTRQLRNMMAPLKEKGLMEGSMIHSLRALRNNSHLLLNTMDVFIHEPHLDWKQFALKQKRQMKDTDEDDGADDNWYPREKVGYVRKKLQGHNPVYITRDELRMNSHLKQSVKNNYEKVLLGASPRDPDARIRSRLPQHGLSVEQQVAALLDQATDPNILGRSWIGWEPWI